MILGRLKWRMNSRTKRNPSHEKEDEHLDIFLVSLVSLSLSFSFCPSRSLGPQVIACTWDHSFRFLGKKGKQLFSCCWECKKKALGQKEDSDSVSLSLSLLLNFSHTICLLPWSCPSMHYTPLSLSIYLSPSTVHVTLPLVFLFPVKFHPPRVLFSLSLSLSHPFKCPHRPWKSQSDYLCLSPLPISSSHSVSSKSQCVLVANKSWDVMINIAGGRRAP